MIRFDVDFKIITSESEELRHCMVHVSNDLKIVYRNYFIIGYVYDYVCSLYEYKDKYFKIEILDPKKTKEERLWK